MELKGKAALVTGGGTGLGRAVALQLAREGVNLAINYSRSAADAEKTARDAAAAFGVKAFTLMADVSDPVSAENLVKEAAEKLGRLDILVNNAGTTKFVTFDDLDGLDPDDFLNLYKTNAMSIYFTGRAAAKIMKKNGGGHIINTVSTAALRPSGSSIAYSVSKAAGLQMTKCLAVALAPSIKVNGVAPGLLLTRWAAGFSDAQVEATKQKTLLKEVVNVEECAAMFLAIARNDSMTGQIITVDAGMTV